MPPWDAPILPGAPPAVGECDINAPAVTIVKRQPLYIEADSRDPVARGSKFCERRPPPFTFAPQRLQAGGSASLRGSNDGRNFVLLRSRAVGNVRTHAQACRTDW
jgi:hypothetical protein